MNENTELNISEYYQTPLSSLSLPDNYKKLIKRIGNLNSSADKEFFVETVGDIIELDPIQLSGYKGVGSLYINTLIEFKKELSYFLNKTKEPDFTFKEDIFTSTDNSYDLYTPLHSLPLSPKYQKLIKKISAIMNNVKIVQDIIDIDIYSFSTLPYVGKLYVNLLINLQNTLAPTDINQSNSDVEKVEKELLPQNTLSTEQLETPLNTLALSTQYQKLIKKISIVSTMTQIFQSLFATELII